MEKLRSQFHLGSSHFNMIILVTIIVNIVTIPVIAVMNTVTIPVTTVTMITGCPSFPHSVAYGKSWDNIFNDL